MDNLDEKNEAPAGARGFEKQRRADLGNGHFLNPILSGDRPDPSILEDGDTYYMVHSSFESYPGLLIWSSKDLVNWQPIGPALQKNVGSVWAPDLIKHRGRYYIYFPGMKANQPSNYVVWSDHIKGPWSDPIDLHIGQIDPGHSVGPDGQRYLFMSGGYRIALAADGLSVTGETAEAEVGGALGTDRDADGTGLYSDLCRAGKDTGQSTALCYPKGKR